MIGAGMLVTMPAADALSRMGATSPAPGEAVAAGAPSSGQQQMPAVQLPLPDEGSGSAPANAAPGDEALPDDAPVDDTTTDDPAKEKSVTKPAPALPILHDLSKLPEPVRRMRQLIMEAAKTGDLTKLRPLIGKGPTATQLAIGGKDTDPIDYLRSVSGDQGGQEILAILLDVLDSGFVDMDKGTPDEAYVWPYFFTTPLATLTPPQRVELFRIITAGDFEDMKAYGGYNFYRVGISPDGQWKFFLAGD
ncbi:MAG: hypothetical protein ACTHJ3_05765 [Pararhizobium sp.]